MTNLFDKTVIDRAHPIVKEGGSGVQKIYRFKNGYGASVVRFKLLLGFSGGDMYGSYTDNEQEYELAVIKFTGTTNTKFEITYDTPITDDVMGHLTEAEVEKILQAIAKLKPWKDTK